MICLFILIVVVIAEWSSWGQWSDGEFGWACTKTCGGGVQIRTRECNNDNAIIDNCVGDFQQNQDCNTESCPGEYLQQ